MDSSKFLIYGLVDPRTQELRYVGKSTKGLLRPRQHMTPAFLRRDTGHKGNWIRQLQAEGLKPEIEVLETHESAEALPDAEQHFIAYFRSLGCRLTNHTDGGEGCVGRRLSAESVARIRESNIRSKSKLSREQEHEMAKLYRDGVDSYKLAERFGIERHTVVRRLKRLGVMIRTKRQIRRRIPESSVAQVIAEYLSGWSTKRLADKYETYSSNIHHLLKTHGIATRDRSEAARRIA